MPILGGFSHHLPSGPVAIPPQTTLASEQAGSAAIAGSSSVTGRLPCTIYHASLVCIFFGAIIFSPSIVYLLLLASLSPHTFVLNIISAIEESAINETLPLAGTEIRMS